MLLPVALPVMSREVFDEMTVCEVFSKSYFKMLLQHFDVDPHQNRWAGGLRSARTWVADSCHFNADLDPAVKFAPYIWIRTALNQCIYATLTLLTGKISQRPKTHSTSTLFYLCRSPHQPQSTWFLASRKIVLSLVAPVIHLLTVQTPVKGMKRRPI